jgi:hypothetical protein
MLPRILNYYFYKKESAMETKLKLIATIKKIASTDQAENQNIKSMFDTASVNEDPISDGWMNDIMSVKPVRSVRQTRSIRRNHSLPIRSLKD